MTVVQPSEVYARLRQLREQATAIQSGITDLFKLLNQLQLSDAAVAPCGACGVPFGGPLQLAEHLYVSHGGPLPEHWAALDARVVDPQVPA